MKKAVFFALALIIIISFALRFYRVTEIPPSLNWDEVSIAYNAYSILETGKDEWNQLLPIHFKSYGEYKLPAQIYFSIPAIALFGLNEFSVRVTPVIYGTLTVLLLFFLAKSLFQNSAIALISAFLLAISPWHIHLTRASFESSFSIMWLVLAIWLLIVGFKRPKWVFISIIPFALAVYTYNTVRIFTPLFLLAMLLVYKSDLFLFRKWFLASTLFFVILMIPFVHFVLQGEGNSRYKLVSITDEAGLIPRINENRGNSAFPEPIPKLIHNKVTYISIYFIQNYLAHFSPDFLFISGAPHKQHHVQNIGQLYLFQAPFLIAGLYLLFREKNKFRWLIIFWILLGIIPVATTRDSIPHALRTLVVLPAFELLSGFGIYRILKYLQKKAIKVLYLTLFLIIILGSYQFVTYLNNYFNNYPILYSRDWQFGYKQVVSYIKANQDKYDKVIFTRHYGEPHMFTLFFLPYNPQKFQKIENLNRFETYDWIRVYEFDKYLFPDLGDKGTKFEDFKKQYLNKKLLFIGKPGDFPADKTILETIYFLNGDKAFEITEEI